MPAITIGKEKALDNEKSTIQKIANVLDDNWTLVVPARKVSLEELKVTLNELGFYDGD